MTDRSPRFPVRPPTFILFLVATSLLVLALAACEPPETNVRYAPVEATGTIHEFTLEAHMDGYYGLDGDIEGEKNPTLQVQAGDTVRFHLVNGENMPHDIAMKNHDDATSELLRGTGQETSMEFVAQNDDEYYCTIPGHEQTGMIGDLEVLRPDDDEGPPRAGLR